MPELEPNVNYEGALNQIRDCVHSVFNKGVKYGRYLERQAMKEREKHGRWEWYTELKSDGHCWAWLESGWKCPKCGEKIPVCIGAEQHNRRPEELAQKYADAKKPYCAGCGAKMDSED